MTHIAGKVWIKETLDRGEQLQSRGKVSWVTALLQTVNLVVSTLLAREKETRRGTKGNTGTVKCFKECLHGRVPRPKYRADVMLCFAFFLPLFAAVAALPAVGSAVTASHDESHLQTDALLRFST